MEGAKVVRDLIRKDDWMVSIDLKDAYLSVPILQEHRKYLRFVWKGTTYEFQCLPFGLSSAPRVFTKLLKPVMALLRKRGIRSLIFLDDMLLMAESREELEQLTWETLVLLRLLGFIINATDTTRGEGAEDNRGLPVSNPQGESISEGAIETDWENVGDNASSPASPVVLLRAPSIEEQSICCFPIFRDHGEPERGGNNGALVVGRDAQSMEWTPDSPTNPRPHHRDGCVTPGLGCSIRADEYRRSLVGRREGTAH